MGNSPPTRPLRILMLHGYTQSGPLFSLKTKALEKHLTKSFPQGVTLSYPTGPHKLQLADFPEAAQSALSADADEPDAWAWFRRKDDESLKADGREEKNAFVYAGLDEGFARLAEVVRTEGPFDGCIGFSQGGCMAGLLASALDEGRREAFPKDTVHGEAFVYPGSFVEEGGEAVQRPLRFAAIYSGFAPASHPAYRPFYEPNIKTPVLHFIGSNDTVVAEHRSVEAVLACEGNGSAEEAQEKGRLVYHPGGHFLPASQRAVVAPLIAFIKDAIAEGGNEVRAKDKEEKAEDMDMPF